MKRWIRTALLSVGAAALMCSGAFAADASSSGVYDAAPESGYTLTPQTVDKSAIPAKSTTINGASKQFYADAVRLELTGPGMDGTQYVVFALSGDKAVPTKSNIVYIDQDAASNGTISFNLYPGSLSSGTYNVYLAAGGGSGLQKVAAFSYYQAYTLGDVDADTYWTANDALYALQIAVNQTALKINGADVTVSDTMRLAADTDMDTYVTANDALLILQKAVGKDVF